MDKFCIKVSGFNIISCTQTYSFAFKISKTPEINKSGNGTMNISALSPDDAVRIAKKYLDGYKKSQISL